MTMYTKQFCGKILMLNNKCIVCLSQCEVAEGGPHHLVVVLEELAG